MKGLKKKKIYLILLVVNKRTSTLDLHQTKNRTFFYILLTYITINEIQFSKKKKKKTLITKPLTNYPGVAVGSMIQHSFDWLCLIILILS